MSAKVDKMLHRFANQRMISVAECRQAWKRTPRNRRWGMRSNTLERIQEWEKDSSK